MSLNRSKSPHELPKNHKQVSEISFLHYAKIRSAYAAILSLDKIGHFALEIANPQQELVHLSSTPAIVHNLCSSMLWRYDKNISPTFYKNKDFYWWEEGYCNAHYLDLKIVRELNHGLLGGFTFVKRIEQFHLLYSFGIKQASEQELLVLLSGKEELIQMADQCYEAMRELYAKYAGQNQSPPTLYGVQ